MKCAHEWRIFKDSDVKGRLTFYCQKCLELRKIDKKYPGEPEKKSGFNAKSFI